MRRALPVPTTLLVATVALAACSGTPPATLGPQPGPGADQPTLAPCPDTPNCVHTGLRHPEGTQGMVLAEDWPERPRAALDTVAGTLEQMTRTRVVERREDYLRAEATSLIFRYVDDVEVLLRDDGEVVVRSASRLGRWDLGVNARRVAELRSRLETAGVIWSVP